MIGIQYKRTLILIIPYSHYSWVGGPPKVWSVLFMCSWEVKVAGGYSCGLLCSNTVNTLNTVVTDELGT